MILPLLYGLAQGHSLVSTDLNLSVGLPRFGGDSGSFAKFVEDFSIFARLQRWGMTESMTYSHCVCLALPVMRTMPYLLTKRHRLN